MGDVPRGWVPEVGSTYSNGKGRYRRVTATGNYPLYDGQVDTHCVLYEPAGGPKGTAKGRMTVNSFRSWAKGGLVPEVGDTYSDGAGTRFRVIEVSLRRHCMVGLQNLNGPAAGLSGTIALDAFHAIAKGGRVDE